MRIFIAINFDESTVERCRAVQERLKGFALRGNFTAIENLHLTLAFLGEVDYGRVPLVETVIDAACDYGAFTVDFVKTGCFKRGGFRSRSGDEGDLWWLGADGGEPLAELQKSLSTALWEAGFITENRPWEPHITLVRQMQPHKDFPGVSFAADLLPFSASVSRVSLMKSERSRGKPVYTEIYGCQLEGAGYNIEGTLHD